MLTCTQKASLRHSIGQLSRCNTISVKKIMSCNFDNECLAFIFRLENICVKKMRRETHIGRF
jgi:hypothetical protein